MPDVAGAFSFLLSAPVSGPVNVCAPEAADVNSLIAQLAGALHRPAVLRVPAPVLRLVMGQLAEELLLASQRLEPAVLARTASPGSTRPSPGPRRGGQGGPAG